MNSLTLRSLIKLVVFAVLTTLVTIVLGVTIANGGTGNGVTYRAEFSDATGLLKGDDVRVAGVRVGQVKAVGIAPSGRTAMVTMTIDKKVAVLVSTTAAVRYPNLVGQRYVALTEGPGDSARLKKDGLIPLSQTKPPLDLTVLFNGFKPLFKGLTPEDVNKLSLEIIQTLQGEGGTIDTLLQHTASLTTTLADRDKVIGSLIDNLNTVLATVDARSAGLDQTIVNLQTLVSGLASDRQTISAALGNINRLASSTASLIEQIRPPLPADLSALSAITDTLASTTDANGKNVLKDTLVKYPDKLNAIIRTATYGSWFNFWLCGGDYVLNGQKSAVRVYNQHPACRP
jgi:phospholipid/cholesterol/gamma-HCH transport system substrate-binding protein